METVTQPPVDETVPLRLFSDGRAPGDLARSGRAGVLSLLIHGVVVALVLALPATIMTPPVVERHLLTPLVEPLTELTQKAPNKTKLSKEFEVAQVEPRPRLAIPPASPVPAPFVPPTPPPQAAAMPEPPRLEPPPPPPQIQAQEKPKLAFEVPVAPPPQPAAISRVPIPNPSVQEAVRSVARGGAGMGMVVGDIGARGAGGIGEGITQSPTSGVQASNLQLLSDPQGVDFRPYLTRILAAVRRNWFAVMPESVRLGRRGRVGIQFAIARNGSVPKLVIVSQSGTEALDRAAVAGISASNPFPPLPTEFRGNEIRLQFNFAYNIPK
jgi:TonB family protein